LTSRELPTSKLPVDDLGHRCRDNASRGRSPLHVDITVVGKRSTDAPGRRNINPLRHIVDVRLFDLQISIRQGLSCFLADLD